MRRTLLAAIATALTAIACPLAAQQPDSTNPRNVQPERPTVATHAGTVARGYFEIETGVERDVISDSISFTGPTVLKLGIASHVQFSVFGSAMQPSGFGTGIGDIGVDVKWRIFDDAPILGRVAIQPMLKFPTGSVRSGAGTGTTDGTLLLISSSEIGPVEMDLNYGYTRRSGNGSNAPKAASLWTASFGGPASGNLGWVAELYGYPSTEGPAGKSSIVALLMGPTYLAKNWLEFDTGIIIPVTGPQPHAIYAGTVINLGRLW